jgi:hypothetical protein
MTKKNVKKNKPLTVTRKKAPEPKKSMSSKKPTVSKKAAGPKKPLKPKKEKVLEKVLKKPAEPKKSTLRLSETFSQPKVRLAKTSPTLFPPVITQVDQKRRRNVGYMTASTLVVALGVLLVSQNEFKDENNYSTSSAITQAKESQNSAPNLTAPVSSEVNATATKKQDGNIAQKAITGPLADEFNLARSLSSSERIKFWSAYIEGDEDHKEKVADLASGFTVEDVAPIIPKKYNCTTFVETVAALSQSDSPDQFITRLIAIRYKEGAANFYARNHLPESDWIPNNQKAGILKDITTSIAQTHGFVAQISRKEIPRNKWLNARAKQEGVLKNLRNIASTREEAAEIPIQAEVPYIKLSQLKEVVAEIPDGTVINLVHDADNRHTGVITHQGFLIREGNQYFLRHASNNGIIRNSELFNYLAKLQKQKKRWPVVGVNLNQFSDSSSSTKRFSDAM